MHPDDSTPHSRTDDATDIRAFPPPVTFGSLEDWLPSKPASMGERSPADDLFRLEKGNRIDDFVIDCVLGRGGFGVVYLAHQLSLGRPVALKIMRDEGVSAEGEGRSLAQLEHLNIVQVYSESIDLNAGVRLLCMQYISGSTLGHLITALSQHDGPRNGAAFVAELDRLDLPAVLFDPESARDREALLTADSCELVCRIGEQLADALAHAHERGVLHRDIKPANVLVNRYGRPFLADFNLSTRSDDGPPAAIGGTLIYMSPEHLEAFRPDSNVAPDSVDEQSDIFSLGVVLWELATGSSPFPVLSGPIERSNLSSTLQEMADQRRSFPPSRFKGDRSLADVIYACLSAEPSARPESGIELAAMLAGVRQRRQTLRTAPPDPLLQASTKRPMLWLMLAGLLPQFGASLLQIVYNTSRIVGELTPSQQALFPRVVTVYNVIVYPLCLSWIGRKLWIVLRERRRLRQGDINQSDDEVTWARKRALELPMQTAWIACVGWFPGAVVFPIALAVAGDPVPGTVWLHFAISFLLGGAIAATYSCFAAYGVILRAVYPRFWKDLRRFHKRASAELSLLPTRMRRLNMLASTVPLLGAIALVLTAPADEGPVYRGLVVTLILSGAFGATVVGHVTRRYIEQVYACRGTLDDASQPRDEEIGGVDTGIVDVSQLTTLANPEDCGSMSNQESPNHSPNRSAGSPR